MAWVPFNEQSTVGYQAYLPPDVYEQSGGEIYYGAHSQGNESSWSVYFDEPVKVKVEVNYYQAASNRSGSIYTPARIGYYGWSDSNEEVNSAPPYPETNIFDDNGVTDFLPCVMEPEFLVTEVNYIETKITSDYMPADEYYSISVYVWLDEVPPPPPPPRGGFRVYELDKGWSFDGAYIPHFLELNWYFGDDPIHYHSLHKIRIHGMSKGYANLTVATNGMQTDYETDYSEPQIIDLPRNMKMLSAELLPETNTVTSANRGLSIQMKFEGRNRDLGRPEPQHVIQVLSLQSSPVGTGRRAE